MSHFTELQCVNRLVIAVPATNKIEDQTKLVNVINTAVREAIIELRKSNVNFLPLEVTTSLESIE
jgi:hypothetical protein